jgi:7-cyano-7-deazaguanine synthase
MTRQTTNQPGPGARDRAVILLSGGLDSYTTAAIAQRHGFVCYGLTVNYGQRHSREIEAAKAVARSLGLAEHKIINLYLRDFGGSALTDDIAVPKTDETIGNDIPVTYVPARNTVLLSLALAWAEVLNAYDIFIGANAVDYSGYPDCRAEFIAAFEGLANIATKAAVTGKGRFQIHAPLLLMNKSDIILQGNALGLDYSLTHSCYDPDSHGLACGKCDSCRLRLKGFEQAHLIDPIEYAGKD